MAERAILSGVSATNRLPDRQRRGSHKPRHTLRMCIHRQYSIAANFIVQRTPRSPRRRTSLTHRYGCRPPSSTFQASDPAAQQDVSEPSAAPAGQGHSMTTCNDSYVSDDGANSGTSCRQAPARFDASAQRVCNSLTHHSSRSTCGRFIRDSRPAPSPRHCTGHSWTSRWTVGL